MKDDSVYLRHILDAIGKIESSFALRQCGKSHRGTCRF